MSAKSRGAQDAGAADRLSGAGQALQLGTLKNCPLFLASAIRSSAKNHGFFRWHEQEQGTSARAHAVRTPNERCPDRASGNFPPTSSEALRSCCLGGHGRVRASRSLRNFLFPLKHHPWNQLTSAHRQQALNRPNVPTKNLVAAAKCCIEIIHVFYRERKTTRQMFSIDTLSLLRITAYHPPQLLVHYSISYSILLSRNVIQFFILNDERSFRNQV